MTGNNNTKSNSSITLLSVVLICVVAFLGFNLLVVYNQTSRDQESLKLMSELRAQSYRLVNLSKDSASGDEDAFGELQDLVGQMKQSWGRLQDNLEGEIDRAQLTALGEAWREAYQNAQTIIDNQQPVIFLNQVARRLNRTLPDLQKEHTHVVDVLLASGAPAEQAAFAQAQSWRAERIGRNVDRMLAGSADAEMAAEQFARDIRLFGQVLEAMQTGDPSMGISRVTVPSAVSSLDNIAEQFAFVSSSMQEIFDATPALFSAIQATNTILDKSPQLQEQLSDMSDTIARLPETRDLSYTTALYAGVLAILVMALIAFRNSAETRRRLRDSAMDNEQNQQAILRLLDEIAGLGEGDLTTHATVTEDFTGAIADSINYAIDQLRILVAQLQDTSENVSAAANETRATALQLAESSEHQAQEIAGASAAINEMAVTIDQVSANSTESANVAQKSVSIAKKGAGVVQNTIGGMDTIREQIQDTSKRIKRLGESSQEIGDIVSLINDIADQTNILALNAAIQASMAGDAGRGFAVVADEVQRLAERSAGATKQIAALVKTIQTDTNEAVSSMEQTTSEVVKGAERAHAAGVALEEIEAVSADLAELIQDISTAAKHQATTAGHVSRTMNVIQDITSQTLSGTNNTAQSIGELAELAVELRKSVSGFKLPAAMERELPEEDDRALSHVDGEQEVAGDASEEEWSEPSEYIDADEMGGLTLQDPDAEGAVATQPPSKKPEKPKAETAKTRQPMRGTTLTDDEFALIDQALHQGESRPSPEAVEDMLKEAEATRDELAEEPASAENESSSDKPKESGSDEYDEEALLKSLQDEDLDGELDFDALTDDFYADEEKSGDEEGEETDESKQSTSTH